MTKLSLFYATNRCHDGANRFRPTGYGAKFSDDGAENLRFGTLTVEADEERIAQCMAIHGEFGTGNGIELASYLAGQAKSATITAYEEVIPDRTKEAEDQQGRVLGSEAMFADVKKAMEGNTDALVYVHGFNVKWHDAVGSALALQEALNRTAARRSDERVVVILLTWPSEGLALPFVSYKSDRTEARASGYAFGRGFLKLRDFLAKVVKRGTECGQDMHLLCHSMGNYVLQNAIDRLAEFSPGALPRIFTNVFMCAPDVDDDVLEDGKPMARLPEIAGNVSIYSNREDKAMIISDYTKGNPERLGRAGPARPALLHRKVNEIDCTPVAQGLDFVEHSYYLAGDVMDDIRQSIDGLPPGAGARRRVQSQQFPNVWTMSKSTPSPT